MFLLSNVLWISTNFGNPSFEQIIFHIRYNFRSLGYSSQYLINNYFLLCALTTFILSVVTIATEENLKILLQQKTSPKNYARVDKFFISKIPLFITIIAVIIAFASFDISSGFASKRNEDFFSRNYIDPSKLKITQKNPRNLILIYVESLEASYSNKDIFKKDLLTNLDSLHQISFSNFRQVPGTGWTMAGITASQCGVPLKSMILEDINLQGEKLDSILSKATCLGDSLKQLGYKNIFLGGASPYFSGKGKFLHAHGYDEIVGREEWLKKYSKDDLNHWGLNDDDLFYEAKLRLDELMLEKKLFNLTLLTIGMHSPKGFISKSCAENGAQNFADIVNCTADEVADFIAYVHNKGYLKNTDIVIMGDHLAMKNPLSDKLKNIKERRIFNLWISEKHFTKSREQITHFDIAPSIMEFIGITVPGGRYGLGYSAFSQKIVPPNIDEMQYNILKESEAYDRLWGNIFSN